MRGQTAHWPWIGLIIFGVLIAATSIVYVRDMQALRDRIVTESKVIQTPHGPVEFQNWGSGPAVLVVHGAGGGYDQGRLLAKAMGGEGFRWIAPSRFGYLRTPLPVEASTAAQAEVFAALLDDLSIDRVALLAMSGGVPPSLQFALRYPERTSALVLMSSAPYTPLTADTQKFPIPIWMYQALFSSDFPFWLLGKVARSRLETIFDVKPALRATLTPAEKTFVANMVDGFLPVTQRVHGVGNEGAAIDPLAHIPVGKITVPTLVIHARDDGINPFSIGAYTAQYIPGADFIPLTSGGHLLLGHHAEIQKRVTAFLHEHTRREQR
jgi:2-hydroxy-6-oxonona-2,4-dienedioate hydrolase